MRKLALVVALALAAPALPSLAEEGDAPPADKRAEARRLLESGKSAFAENKLEEAARLFGAAYEADSSLDAALFNQAFAYRRAEKYSEARAAYARYLALHPDDLDTIYALGRTEQLLGNKDEARRHYAAYVEKETRAERTRYIEHAKEMLAELGPPPAAPAALALTPVPAPAPAIDLDARFAEGMQRYVEKRYAEAAPIFLEVYTADEKRTAALYRYALALRQAGDLDGARAAYERFLGVAPSDPDALYGLAETERTAGKGERAIGLYERYIEVEKRPSEEKFVQRAKEYVALLLSTLAAPPAPVVEPAVAEPVEPQPPSNPIPPVVEPAPPAPPRYGPRDTHRPLLAHRAVAGDLLARGEKLLADGDAQGALEAFTQALAAEPDDGRATRGRQAALDESARQAAPASTESTELEALLQAGDEQLAANDSGSALKSFQRALALAPSSARPLWGLARAYERAGLRSAARHHYRLYRASNAPDRDEQLAREAFWKLESP